MSEPSEPGPGESPDNGTEPPPPDFDPYRFGAPEHPVPPEYAPPGYRPPYPPPPPPPPSGYPPPGYGQSPHPPQPGYPGYPGYPEQPGQSGYQYPPQPPPYTAQYPPPRTGHGKAIAALVLGILSIVLCVLSLFDAVPVILALIFGGIALSESRRRPNREGRGMAIAGIACAIVGAILATVFSVWIYGKVKDCTAYEPGSSAYTQCIHDHL